MQTQLKLRADRATQDSASGSRTVKILRSAEEVESVREFWSSCSGTLDSDIDVFLTKNSDIPEGLRPCVLVLYRGGKPVALMAGRIVRRRIEFRLGWFTLFKPLVNVFTIRGGLRGDASSDSCQELVRAIIECLKNGEADVALLSHVDADSALFRCLKSKTGFLFRDHFTPLRPHRKRVLPGSIDQLYAELSGNERWRFRRIAKRLSNEFSGKVRVDRFETLAGLDRTLTVVEEVARKTWQRAMGGGFSMEASLLKALRIQAEGGWLRIYTLYLADKPCAFWIGALYRRTFYSEYLGYNLEYASYSVGTYLLSRMMQDFCSEGVEAIDFGSSDEEYKKRYGNVMWHESDLHVFAPSPRGLILSGMKMITVLLREPTRTFLERTNLIQRVKKIWRRVSMNRVESAPGS